MNNLIINEIEAIDEVVNESKIDQLMTIASIYDKQFTIIEEYQYRNKSDVSGFKIFQESFYQEGEILDKAIGKGKDESMLDKIVAFIPRLVGAIIDSIKKLFSGDSKKKAEEAAEKASKFSPQKLATVGGILGAAGLGFIGGKALSDNTKEDPETVKKNEELTKANQDLNEANKNLTDENNNLKNTIVEKDKQFEAEMKELKNQIKSLSESELAKENEKLRNVKDGLIKQVRAASDENRNKRDRDVKEAQEALNIKINQWNEIKLEYLRLKKSHNQLSNNQQALLKALKDLRTNQKDIIESVKGSPLSDDKTVLDFVNVLNKTIEELAYDKKIANTTLQTRTKELADTEKERDNYKTQVEEARVSFDKIKNKVLDRFNQFKSIDDEQTNLIDEMEKKIISLSEKIEELTKQTENTNKPVNDDDNILDIINHLLDIDKDDNDESEAKKDSKTVDIPVSEIIKIVEKETDPDALTLVADITEAAKTNKKPTDNKKATKQEKKTQNISNDNLKKLGTDVDKFSKSLTISIDNLSKIERNGNIKQFNFYNTKSMHGINTPFIFDTKTKEIYSRVNFELLIENINIISNLIKADFDDSAIKKTIASDKNVKTTGKFHVYPLNKKGVVKLYGDFDRLNNSLTKINSAVKGIATDKYDEKKKAVIKNINKTLTNYTVIIDNLCKVFDRQVQALDQATK